MIIILRPIAPTAVPEVLAADLLTESQDWEVNQDIELLRGRRSPIGKSLANWDAFTENRAKVRRECEIERGFNGGELLLGETLVDGNVGMVMEIGDEISGIGGN